MINTVLCYVVGKNTQIIKLLYFLVVTNPDDCLKIANTCLQKDHVYEFSKSWLGEGLLTSDGKYLLLNQKAFFQPDMYIYLHLLLPKESTLLWYRPKY